MANTVRGACLCGAVRFEITLPVNWCAHCHCSMCRRAHGAPYVTWVGVARERLSILSGEQDLVRYHSSARASRRFCRRCGSQLFFEAERWPAEVHVARALITEGDEALPAPEAHYYFDSRAAWVRVDDGLPRRGGPSGTEPLPPDRA